MTFRTRQPGLPGNACSLASSDYYIPRRWFYPHPQVYDFKFPKVRRSLSLLPRPPYLSSSCTSTTPHMDQHNPVHYINSSEMMDKLRNNKRFLHPQRNTSQILKDKQRSVLPACPRYPFALPISVHSTTTDLSCVNGLVVALHVLLLLLLSFLL